MWPLGTLIARKVPLLFLIVHIWTGKSGFQMSFGQVIRLFRLSSQASCEKHACFKQCSPCEPLFVYISCLQVNDELYWHELWSRAVCPRSWRAKQKTFKLAPDVKTLVGPLTRTSRSLHHCCHTRSLSNSLVKSQALLQRAQVSLPGKAGTQVPCYVWFNWANWH